MKLQTFLIFLGVLLSTALSAQNSQKKTVLQVYKDVYFSDQQGHGYKKVKPNDVFVQKTDFVFASTDAAIYFYNPVNKATFVMDANGDVESVNIPEGERIQVLENFLSEDRKRLPKKFFKEEIKNKDS